MNFSLINNALAICQYDCRVFEPEILLDILTTHPIAVIGTEIYENFYYIPTEEFLAGKAPQKTLEHWTENLKLRKKMEKTIRENEVRYSLTLDAVNDGLWEWNVSSGDAFFSPNYYKLLGYEPGEFPANYQSWRLLLHPADIDSVEKQLQESIKFGRGFGIDLRMKTKSNEWLWVSTRGNAIEKDSTGTSTRMVGTLTDITDRKNAELALIESEEKFREVFNNANDAMFLHKLVDGNPGKFLEVNDVACQILGYSRNELLNMSPMDIDTPETLAKMPMVMENLLNEGKSTFEAVQMAKDGELLPVEINAHIFNMRGEKYILSISRDIRERKTAEIKVKKALQEKEMLLKEIHHRVKNNLMIISRLLNLQSSYIKDKESQDLFKESQNRARSMALIHEKLYQSTDLKRIDFGEYINSLATELFHTYVADPSLIELKINVDDIFLDINNAISLGLIVNEFITNSLQHAFPHGETGEIEIKFHSQDDKYILEVNDNGIGFPKDIDYKNTESLGLTLVTSLTEQIDGEIELNSTHGTSFKIIFTEEKFDN